MPGVFEIVDDDEGEIDMETEGRIKEYILSSEVSEREVGTARKKTRGKKGGG